MIMSIIEFIKDIFKYLVVIAVIVLVRIYVLTSTEVIGDSMEPNLNDGNMVLIETISPKIEQYKRFDTLVIKYTSPKYIIKRLIGLPNETIKYEDNKLYVNNEYVEEEFDYLGTVEDFEIVIPEGKYFVLGDNRGDSKDSRDFGPIIENDIMGKPILRIWPINKAKIVR